MLQKSIAFLLKSRLRFFLFLSLFSFILYGQSINFGYTDLDDSVLLQDNFSFLEKSSNIGKIFTQSVFNMRPEDKDNYYRPLLSTSFMLDTIIGKRAIKPFHISNIIIHIIASFLLFTFLTKLQYKKEISFIVTILFLTHPAFTTAVAWIPGRNDSLLAIFVLGALIKQIDYLNKQTRINLFLHHLLFLGCLFTKETAIILPIIFYLFIIFFQKGNTIKKKDTARKNKTIGFIAGWCISIFIYEYFRYIALGTSNQINFKEAINVFEKFAATIIQYVGKLLFPVNLSTYPIMEDTTYLLGILALILIIVFIHLKRTRGSGYYFAGLACFLLFLFPVAFIKENALEHRLYLPAIGFSIMCIENNFITKINFNKNKIWIITFGIAFVFSILTFSNTKYYKDEITFWTSALETSPHSARVHMQAGSYYQINGKLDEAEKEYKIALELNPDLPNIHNNLGRLYISKKMFNEAELHLKMELEIKPNPSAYYNLAIIQEEKENFEEAKNLLQKSLEINSDYTDALVDLGILYAREQKFNEALELLFRTIKIEPSNKLANKNIALIYLATKKYNEAKIFYLKSKQLGTEMNIPFLDTLK